MTRSIILGLLVTGIITPTPLAAQPPADRVEAALKAFCETSGVPRTKVEAVQTKFVPGSQVFRYRLPAEQSPDKKLVLHERYALVFVDTATGQLTEVKETLDRQDGRGRLLAVIRLAGRKVRTADEDTAFLDEFFPLEHALHTVEPWTRAHDLRHKAFFVYTTGDDEGYVTGIVVKPIR